MELDKFISESLLDIAKGLKEVNRKLKEESSSPDTRNCFSLRPGSKVEQGAGIEFDVAITTKVEAEGKGSAKIRLAVVDADIGGGGGGLKENVSRIKFKVNIGHWLA